MIQDKHLVPFDPVPALERLFNAEVRLTRKKASPAYRAEAATDYAAAMEELRKMARSWKDKQEPQHERP